MEMTLSPARSGVFVPSQKREGVECPGGAAMDARENGGTTTAVTEERGPAVTAWRPAVVWRAAIFLAALHVAALYALLTVPLFGAFYTYMWGE
ncbi:hypothetical protein PR048_006824 [Dryococelus australis]|uniref:Uncharacterized protein n=1 Tax=Dryococelus australis TaxID=614101 RepID=A0ABQ9IBZ9_9NEOP|nr:hypothetical protein PR048_006824 [Dryococelus australis]